MVDNNIAPELAREEIVIVKYKPHTCNQLEEVKMDICCISCIEDIDTGWMMPLEGCECGCCRHHYASTINNGLESYQTTSDSVKCDYCGEYLQKNMI